MPPTLGEAMEAYKYSLRECVLDNSDYGMNS